ncbi:MAG TPA: hypothetical protein VNE62_07200 [Actinomycetota bacterium]|nr:hypothetical protein [Actinomycetota bacterium]
MKPAAGRPWVVCLCGSTRLKADFLKAQQAEALAGHVVLAPGVYSHADGIALSDQDISRQAALHRHKIAMADEIAVVAPGGAIGEATAAEIALARQLGKPVRFLEASLQVPVDPVDALLESHAAQRLVTNAVPTVDVPEDVKQLRCALIEEEAAEFRAAVEADDLIGIADAIGDLLYVVYGAALTFGIPVRQVFAEVHRSNMTKLDADGNPIYRSDGKVMKGPAFSPPDLSPILRAAGYRAPGQENEPVLTPDG